MERQQIDWEHEYLATPSEYPISDNNRPATYDQFIQLRDTLIFTGKYYNDKASRKLCVGDKWDGSTTNTIEVWLPNYFRQLVPPDWDSSPLDPSILGKYITSVPSDLASRFWPLSCMITKDWRYRIKHKEEILLYQNTAINKVFCYVDVYRNNWTDYEIAYKWWVAVRDWEGQTSLSGTTSGTEPNGTCHVSITLGKLFRKMTALADQERNLLKGDILVLRMKDWPHDPTTWEPTGNNLPLQADSNYRSIEYLDLPYNI